MMGRVAVSPNAAESPAQVKADAIWHGEHGPGAALPRKILKQGRVRTVTAQRRPLQKIAVNQGGTAANCRP